MGIKGIYGEIGPGERIALSKLAIEKFEETGRPLRIAIDISIWQFQTLAGQGGSNPAIRTFYYRLLRLLSTSIQPLFIFDGPNKPPFKRNKRIGQHGAMVPNLLTKQLLKLFGFPFYMAPGEAEAECALLQREGIVDAVLSEDVDTLMFGCGRTLRNWSSEGSRGNKSPTHVSVYDAKATKEGKSGLDREGMILIALMSGGDYITEGIPGCGIKVACEAARAGFGRSLCQIVRSDAAGLRTWREHLAHEIKTNESKFFRVKHKTLKIPDDFPNKEVLGYYTHPVVSSASRIQKLKKEIEWEGDVDVQGLRVFVADAFDWSHKMGARKFIRGLAPAILVHKLRTRTGRRDSEYGDVVLTAMNEMELVRAICGKRNHISTDGIPELRVIYHPAEIVGLDLDAEEDDSGDHGRDGLAPVNDDDQIEEYVSDDATSRSRLQSPTKRAASIYDPTQPDKAWIPESIAKVGIPLKVEDYEESLRDPKKFIKTRFAAKKAAAKGGMPKGAMDRFVKIIKPLNESARENELVGPSKPAKRTQPSTQPVAPPVYLAPTLERLTSSQAAPTTKLGRSTRVTRSSTDSSTGALLSKPTRSKKANTPKPAPNTNPWTIAHLSSSPQARPSIQKPISQQPKSTSPVQSKHIAIHIDSSPPEPPSLAPLNAELSSPSRKHTHSPIPPSEHESERGPELPPTVRLTRGSHRKEPSTPTKGRQDIDRPSPRKISPDLCDRQRSEDARSRSETLGIETVARKLDFTSEGPPSTDTGDEGGKECQVIPNQMDELGKPVADDFDLPVSKEQASYSAGVSPISPHSIPARPGETEVIDLASSSPVAPKSPLTVENTRKEEIPSSPTSKPRAKKYIVVRESTDGTFWERADDEQAKGRGTAYRYSQVETLDLTGDD